MKNNIFKTGAAFFLGGLIFGLAWFFFSQPSEKITIRGRDFQAEVAATPEKRELGLGGREALCEKCALLFVFPEKEIHSFWMKGMKFPLDIIWFDSADGRIVHLEKNIPVDSQAIFTPETPADRVLEINGGLADQFGIQVGDEIRTKAKTER